MTKALQVFYKQKIVNNKPVIDTVLCIIEHLDDIPKLKQLKLEMLVKDIDRNRHRNDKVLHALQDVQHDVQDKKHALKRLVKYHLISWDQYRKLNELINWTPSAIADIISTTKVGQGFDLLPNVISRLRSRMIHLLNDMKQHGKDLVGKELKAIIDELLRRGGIAIDKHMDISKLL